MEEEGAKNGNRIQVSESRPNFSQCGMDFKWKARGFSI